MSSRNRVGAARATDEDVGSIRLALAAMERAQQHLAEYFERNGGRPDPDSVADNDHDFAIEHGAAVVDEAVYLLRAALK